ncbi:hypothetical protein BC826DRAFT_1085044, partial [Russula brevipes]
MRAMQGRAGPTDRTPRIDKVPSQTRSQRTFQPRPTSNRRADLPRCPPTHEIAEAGERAVSATNQHPDMGRLFSCRRHRSGRTEDD